MKQKHLLPNGYPSNILLIIAFCVLTFADCSAHPSQKIQLTGQAEGTYYNIIYYDDNNVNYKKEVDSVLHAFDRIMSLWDVQSQIFQVNNNKDIELDSIFIDVYNKSHEIAELSSGAFDYTIGALTSVYGFGFANRGDISDAMVDSLKKNVGYKKIKVINRRLVKDNPNIKLDFNAVAKGYMVDLLGNFFERKGIVNYLVDVGGEVHASGLKPDGSLWVVGIEKPTINKEDARQIFDKVELNNKSIATSGNYRKYYEENGVRYGHTIDPVTGRPAKNNVLSVSVIETETWRADAFATAFLVLGLEKSLEILKKYPHVQAYFILADGHDQFNSYKTPNFGQ